MQDLALAARVARIKHTLNVCARDPRNRVWIESVSVSELQRLRDMADFPADMLLILSEIGKMHQWGINGCAVIDWCVPCRIDDAVSEGRCFYDVREKDFVNGERLLFFAWDCHAKVWLYDTATRPWRVVSTDGLEVSSRRAEDVDGTNDSPSWPPVEPWDEGGDAISVVESWVEWAESFESQS